MVTQEADLHFRIPKPIGTLAASVAALFILVFFIQMLLVPLQGSVSPVVSRATNLCFTFSVFIVLGFGAVFVKTALAKEEDRNIYVSYLGLELLFNFALILFLVLLLMWIAYLRGVLNSPFSALMSTAPVSLLFITLRTRNALPPPQITTRQMEVLTNCLKRLVGYSRVLPITLFIVCAIAIDLFLSNFFTQYSALLESRVIGVAEHSELRTNIWYAVLSYTAFYGSVISTLITCYPSTKVAAT